MPTFFFDLRTPAGLDPDESGSEFAGLESAYLDACRAVFEMSAELLRERRDPELHAFEIRDAARRLLLELPFREVLRPGERRPAASQDPGLRRRLAHELERGRALRSDMRASLAQARTTLERSRELLGRARGR